MRSVANSASAAALGLALLCGSALAAPAKVEQLLIDPESVTLGDADERVQLLVTAQGADGSLLDVTREAQYHCSDPALAEVSGGLVAPRGDGSTQIEIRFSDPIDGHEVTSRVPVSILGFGVSRGLNFANDIEPILSKFSCNSGGCHGKASGQNGFKLSLLGFDPALDYDALVKQGHGRRVFPAAPARSLLVDQAQRPDLRMAEASVSTSTRPLIDCCCAGSNKGCPKAASTTRAWSGST